MEHLRLPQGGIDVSKAFGYNVQDVKDEKLEGILASHSKDLKGLLNYPSR